MACTPAERFTASTQAQHRRQNRRQIDTVHHSSALIKASTGHSPCSHHATRYLPVWRRAAATRNPAGSLRTNTRPTHKHRHQHTTGFSSSPSAGIRQSAAADGYLLAPTLPVKCPLNQCMIIQLPPKIWRPKPACQYTPEDNYSDVKEDLFICPRFAACW